jgi:Fe-Mn family superoxide dismutase
MFSFSLSRSIEQFSRHLLGRINHSLFGTNLAPSAAKGNGHGGVLKEGPLKAAIGAAFGSPNALKK